MSEHIRYFKSPAGCAAVALPFDFRQAIADWAALRKRMVKEVPPAFTRDEWAYLVTFLEPGNLEQPFIESFGAPIDSPDSKLHSLYRPRGAIAVWLPNNVSLLGPLTLVLLSLTGQPIRLKLGSSAEDLTGAFLDYALANLPLGALADALSAGVLAESFERDDLRHAEWAREARVRIVFGSDEAARVIHQQPHPLDSVGFSFTDRQSEAWLEPGAIDDRVVETLLKVFTIYGQAGCTSPRRVILLDGSEQDAQDLRDRLLEAWPRVVRGKTPMHVASENLMAEQWARALGWAPRRAPGNAGVLASGAAGLPGFEAQMALRIQAATVEQAMDCLPANIQTVGHALKSPDDPAWKLRLAGSRILRFVPLGEMHYFGSRWDGQDFWRQCFAAVEIGQ
jgi:hypothetical protein